ncbi:MAG: hypothetical protein LAP85_29415 [Acidobacteriia bacterium]|nr:hypothetical protein [Terriglobia bacterium]
MTDEFKTEDLPLACYIIARRALPFLGCLKNGGGRACFLFAAPAQAGEALEAEYMSGGQVSALEYHAALRQLRKAMHVVGF